MNENSNNKKAEDHQDIANQIDQITQTANKELQQDQAVPQNNQETTENMHQQINPQNIKNCPVPDCKKSILIPNGFTKGQCPYCSSNIEYDTKINELVVPYEILDDNLLAKAMGKQQQPPPAATQQPPTIEQQVQIQACGQVPPQQNLQQQPTQTMQQQSHTMNNPPPNQQQTQQINNSEFVSKKAAAQYLLYWLKGYKTMSIVAIVSGFACLVLGMLFLDLIGMAVIIAITAYCAFIMKKVVVESNRLMATYNLVPYKQQKLFKNMQQQPQQQYNPPGQQQFPIQQQPIYPQKRSLFKRGGQF